MHEHWMELALRQAVRGYSAPNPLVGCVIVKDGEWVSSGFHLAAGLPHAEVEALRGASPKKLVGSDVYVTLEPCAHQGRTPSCAQALIEAKVARVIVAMRDPGIGKGGCKVLRAAGIEVIEGVLEDEARRLNAIWLSQFDRGRPFVTLKAAITLDGRLGPGLITNSLSRHRGRQMRAQHGAVLVGAETALMDNPMLTVREEFPMAEPPIRIVLDPRRRLPDDLKLFTDEKAPTWRVVSSTHAAPGDVVVPMRDGALDLGALLSRLTEAGIPGLLVEGGARTHASFHQQGLVDRLCLFLAPSWKGEGPVWDASLDGIKFSRVASQVLAEDVLIQYDVHGWRQRDPGPLNQP